MQRAEQEAFGRQRERPADERDDRDRAERDQPDAVAGMDQRVEAVGGGGEGIGDLRGDRGGEQKADCQRAGAGPVFADDQPERSGEAGGRKRVVARGADAEEQDVCGREQCGAEACGGGAGTSAARGGVDERDAREAEQRVGEAERGPGPGAG